MRAIVLSDIHSNIWALEAVFRQEKRYDAVYCAGDLVDYGLEPVRVISFCRDHGFIGVMGNHDEAVLGVTRAQADMAVRTRAVRWREDNFQRLGADELAYLAAQPAYRCFEMDGIAYQMQHRLTNGYETPVFHTQLEAAWHGDRNAPYKRLILGHTHRQTIFRMTETVDWINPGSVSYRGVLYDDGDRRAQYMVVEDGDVRFMTVDYDHAPMMRVFAERAADPRMSRTEVEVLRYLLSNDYETYAQSQAAAMEEYQRIMEGRA